MDSIKKKKAEFEALRILGVPFGSEFKNYRKAFLRLSKTYHPNKGGDPEKFKEILSAYNNIKLFFP